MKYYLIAGEASGDLHGSNLMKALAECDAQADFRFFGGDLMSAAGGTCVRHYKNLAYMGFWPVLTHLGTILRSGHECLADIANWRPDAVILIDYPGFNLSIARNVHKNLGIPVYYYISPKLWAWKGYRIRGIRRDVNRLFSILPFEVEYFHHRGYEVDYVGNPCVDAVEAYRSADKGDAKDLTTSEKNEPRKPVIALLAGSRRQEISRNLPAMLQAAQDLVDYELLLAAAPGIDDDFYASVLDRSGLNDISRLRVERSKTYAILEQARAALVTSGTATLETALFRVPQVVCYKLPAHWIGLLFKKFILKVDYVSLVNLIAGREVVPELLGGDMNAGNVRAHLLPLLQDSPASAARKAQLSGYDEMITILGPSGASHNAATAIYNLLTNPSHPSAPRG